VRGEKSILGGMVGGEGGAQKNSTLRQLEVRLTSKKIPKYSDAGSAFSNGVRSSSCNEEHNKKPHYETKMVGRKKRP